MKKLDTYIDDNNIIFYLCRIRAKVAKERNKKHLIHLISSNTDKNYHTKDLTVNEEEICALFPSRKKWKKLGKDNRYKNKKKLNTLEKNIRSLQITIEWYRKNEPEAEFLTKLDEFIVSIKNSVVDNEYSIKEPTTYPKRKDNKKKDVTICRPISIFNLKDRIIICLVNKYFTELFDDLFYDNSMAFRAVRKENDKYINITHHDAIKSIVDYKRRNKDKPIWVSECDMKKFYDTVNHTIIKKFFKRFIKNVQKNKPEFFSEHAERLFYSYLDCYTFNKSVYPLNNNDEYFSQFGIKNGKFEWVESDLIEGPYKKLNNAKIGVPQGGALSGLIANIVLHHSDTIINKRKDKNLLYIRYCDDMIIMHPNKRACQSATRMYHKSLLQLKLVPHSFETVSTYCKNFWKSKSKNPYKWGEISDSNIPWIGFVGYELNFNGNIRIRKSSLKKEMSKQVEVINTAYDAIKNNNKRATDKYIEESVIHRLIGMSVGRVTMWNFENGINDLCWINGFSELTQNTSVSIQLKRLDRNRNKYFRQFKRKVRAIEVKEEEQVNTKTTRQMIYFGKPFSYYYQSYEKPCPSSTLASRTG